MESAAFRKWLAEQGCRFDRHEHQQRGQGHRRRNGTSRGPHGRGPPWRLPSDHRRTRGASGL